MASSIVRAQGSAVAAAAVGERASDFVQPLLSTIDLLRYVALPLRHEIADHEAKEAIVRASALDWTIVRPPKLTGGARTGRYRSGPTISTWKPMPLLSREDLSDFILCELAEPRYMRQATRLLH